MALTVISDKLVKIEPDRVDGKDILEFAEALIREHGHVKGTAGDEQSGFSIHGAVNEAAVRVTETGKDSSYSRPLRDEATELLLTNHPGQTDLTLNDNAPDQNAVLAYLQAAREETHA